MDNYVLVTGGAGYIGSHACKQLKKNGYTPVTYDNLLHGHREAVKWGPLIEGDILDTKKVFETLKEFKIKSILHFAALASVGESVEKPDLYYKNNVVGSLSLCEAALKAGVNRFVFSSTCATYGIPEKVPMTEDFPQNPINPYGQTKLMIEKMLQDFSKAYDFKSVCLRYFNASGADADGDTGENHHPETHLMPLAIRSALSGKTLKIFGQDYPTTDGTCVRDYIHVTDLADAHILALKYLDHAQENFSFFNLGTAQGYSVKEIIQAVEKVSGKKVPCEIGPRRPGDPAALVASNAKAFQLLNWKPQFNSIETIIRTAYNWHSKQGNLK